MGSIGVLRHTRMPATLIELAFIDSPAQNLDVGILRSFRPEMAAAIAKGVYAYFGMEFEGLNAAQEKDNRAQADQNTEDGENEGGENPVSNSETAQVIFNTLQEVPDWGRPTIEKLMAAEALLGDEDGILNLTKREVRGFVVNDRMGVYDRGGCIGDVVTPDYPMTALCDNFVNASPETKEMPRQPDSQPQIPNAPLELTDFEMEALCKIVWAEARGKDELGQRLVVHVVRNRMASPDFPDNLLEVLFQRNAFSPVHNGAFGRAVVDERIRQRVLRALEEIDQAQGATFFRSIVGVEGSWHENNLTPIFEHGAHRFYG